MTMAINGPRLRSTPSNCAMTMATVAISVAPLFSSEIIFLQAGHPLHFYEIIILCTNCGSN